MSDKPNFRIIENRSVPCTYEEFKVDFMNPDMLIEDIKKKWGLSHSEYNNYRARVCEEENMSKKKSGWHSISNSATFRRSVRNKEGEFIRERDNGFVVVKNINYTTKYFGRYKDYETACMVRDDLIKHNWDFELGEYYKEKYGMKRQCPTRKWAEEFYPKWEELYFHSRLSIKAIKEKYNISHKKYVYLLELLHEKHGKVNRRDFVKCL